MPRSIVLKAILPLLIMTFAVSAQAGTVTLTDTITQSGWADYLDPDGTIGTFDFTGDAGLASLASITEISIRMWIIQGDTDVGEFDYTQLTLVLDGNDSGVELNGFYFDGHNPVEETNSAAPNFGSSILSALKSDSKLDATVLDHSTVDNWIRIDGTKTATLTITGSTDDGQLAHAPIPQAAPLGFLLMGGLGLLGWTRRRRREF